MTQPPGQMPQQPWTPQPGAVPQPTPSRKRKKWPWVVGTLAALVIVSAIAGGGDSDDTPRTASDPAPADAAAPAAPADAAPVVADPQPGPAAPGLHTPVRDGKFEFVVTDVQTGLAQVGDNPYLIEKAQGQFVVVTMTVHNISGEPKGLSPSDQDLYDEAGRTFTANTMAGISLGSDVAVWDQINPGNTVTMQVVFDMPVDAIPAEIELHDSMFSGGTRVALR